MYKDHQSAFVSIYIPLNNTHFIRFKYEIQNIPILLWKHFRNITFLRSDIGFCFMNYKINT